MNQNNTAIAPVATTTAATVATTTETKKTSPAREGRAVVDVKVEAAEVETWTCVVTGEERPVDKMLVPKLGTLDQKLGHRTTEADLRTRAVSAKGAMAKGINRDDLMFLDIALEVVRKDDEKAAKAKYHEAEKTARIQEDAAFRKEVFVGQPKAHPRTGKVHVRCVQGRNCEYAMEKGTAFVGSTDVMQAPSLEEMQLLNYEARRGKVVDVSQLMSIYALCPKCATKFIENPQSVAKAEEAILGDLEQNAEVYAAEADRLALVSSYIDAADLYVPRTPRGKRSAKPAKHNTDN